MCLVTYRIQVKPEECARARVLAGYSVRAAALAVAKGAVRCTPTHLGYVEAGKRRPSARLLKALADLYGVPMTSLFTEVDDAEDAA